MIFRAFSAEQDSCRLRSVNIFIMKKTNALCLDLRPVIEPDDHAFALIHRDAFHQNAEGHGVELISMLRQVFQLPNEAVHASAPADLFPDLLLQGFVFVLKFLIPCAQTGCLAPVLRLIQRDAGVSHDRLRQLTGGFRKLRLGLLLLCAEGGSVINGGAQRLRRSDDFLAVIAQPAHGFDHNGFQLRLGQVRRAADGASILVVALPDNLAVLVGGVPDLGAVQASAVPAIYDAGEEIGGCLFALEELDLLQISFSEPLWNITVDHVTVYADERLVFLFKNGSGIAVKK